METYTIIMQVTEDAMTHHCYSIATKITDRNAAYRKAQSFFNDTTDSITISTYINSTTEVVETVERPS